MITYWWSFVSERPAMLAANYTRSCTASIRPRRKHFTWFPGSLFGVWFGHTWSQAAWFSGASIGNQHGACRWLIWVHLFWSLFSSLFWFKGHVAEHLHQEEEGGKTVIICHQGWRLRTPICPVKKTPFTFRTTQRDWMWRPVRQNTMSMECVASFLCF